MIDNLFNIIINMVLCPWPTDLDWDSGSNGDHEMTEDAAEDEPGEEEEDLTQHTSSKTLLIVFCPTWQRKRKSLEIGTTLIFMTLMSRGIIPWCW